MTYRRAAAVLAACLFLAGIGLLFTPVSAPDPTGAVACGSVVSPDNSAPDANAPDVEVAFYNHFHAECQSALSSQSTKAAVIGGIGLLGVAFFLLTMRRRSLAPHQPAHAEHDERQPSE